ncbi:DegT/DnrJ/EryC1/StrS family aminotransferase [Rubritalea marina]|uniref:DegT/DnrJ/EryC1/StrS family aminotransferase n=1 Tax=Rubritalea marina TaxID=361055 RepID=UPI0003758E53|nr:DegT/DnrJ/EryC1/StrS family aminotransferase [Rubritalea marina]
MPVPLLDVNAQNLPLQEELIKTFEKVLQSGRFIMGEEMEAFESEVAEMVGAKHGISVSSGTDAILLALMVLGLGEGDEVLCPSFTFFATAGCIARTGATPVFVDCCPVCFNIDIEDAKSKLSSKTKAVIPVHLFGQAANMDAVMELAYEHDLKVIEDGAQAIGATFRGRGVGSIGDFGTYSFFPSKNLGGFGDGGMLVTNDDALAEKALMLRNHGMSPKYYHKLVGGNFRCDALQAALLRVKLREYETYTQRRQANAAYYIEQLVKLSGVVQADPSHCGCAEQQRQQLITEGTQLVLPVSYEHNEHIWNQFTIRVLNGKRDAMKAFLTEKGIGCDTYYPVPLHQQECFDGLSKTALPVSEMLAEEVISIPVYPELSKEQKDEVITEIQNFIKN